MAGRIESEAKKTVYMKACESINTLKVVPEKLLQAQHLIETLKMDEIDMTMLYKCGCPCDWVKEAQKQCHLTRGQKLSPRYSNECATCWLFNLTDEITNITTAKMEIDIKEILARYDEYEKLGFTPEQLAEILTYLGWMDIYDYGLFLDTVKDMKHTYLSDRGKLEK